MAREQMQVLVIELDEAVRGTLRDVLGTAGDLYAVTEVGTDVEALARLTTRPVPDGMVVVCSNTHADHHTSAAFFAAVVADKRLAARHQYILLSTNPARIPDEMRAHLTRLNAVVLPKPFDIDELLATVREAAARLATAHAPPYRRLWRRMRRQTLGRQRPQA